MFSVFPFFDLHEFYINSNLHEFTNGSSSFTRIKVFSEKAGFSSSQALAGKISLQLPTVQLSNTSPRALRKTEYAITLLNVLPWD